MTKRLLHLIALALIAATATAQTLHIVTGNVSYDYTADQAGEMTYSDGGTVLTVGGKAFNISDITKIYTDKATVKANTVSVDYNGTAATVAISGNVASYVTATVSGAHVTLAQSNTADVDGDEIYYSLSGSSTDGGLVLTGAYKCEVDLNGLVLTNPTGAALDIQNGKRVTISIKKGTENTLTDGAGSQKACLYVKGHAEFKGKGTLNVYGNYAHAIKSGDYTSVKNCVINVLTAVKDGISCNEYFLMESGTLSITGVGDDAIQVDLDGTASTGEKTDHEDEDTGNFYMLDGSLTATVTATAAKCIKSAGLVRIDGGTLQLTASGTIDVTDPDDPSYTAGIKGEQFEQNGGDITMTITGIAGRGVSATDITTNGGTLTISNSGEGQAANSEEAYTAKGLKCENLALNAGTINITMTGKGGKGIRVGSGTKTTSGNKTTYKDVTGSFTMGTEDGNGPSVTVKTTGATQPFSTVSMGRPGPGQQPGGGFNPGGESSASGSDSKAIKAICAIYIYGGTTDVSTATDGAEGLESKTGIWIEGGQHYFKCYDDCINSLGKIYFEGGTTVCYSYGNDAVDSNAGTSGAITIGNGALLAYSTKGSPEEGIDCDNNSYIAITGKGIGIGLGGKQSSATGTISGAAQGYAFPGTVSFNSTSYYTLADSSGNPLVTFKLPAAISSQCTFLTATGMVAGNKYYLVSQSAAPTDATTSFQGLYLGSTTKVSTSGGTTVTAK